MIHCRHLLLSFLLLMTSGGVQAQGQSFPSRVRNQSGTQIARLLKRAGTENMIVSGLSVRLLGRRIVFDVEFAENKRNTRWLIRLNQSDADLKSFSEECEPKGYERRIEAAVRVRGELRHSVVWTLTESPAGRLILPDGPIPESGLEDSRLQPLDSLMRDFLRQYNVAGGTLAVAKNDRLVYARGFGYADVQSQQPMQPQSVMRIASISKPITAVAVLILADRGQLSLDDRIVPLLTKNGYSKPEADDRWNDITIRHLLQHSGGWDRSVSKDPMFQVVNITQRLKLRHSAKPQDILRYQLTQPLDFAPGARYAYCNFGYSVLGRVISIVTGKPFPAATEDLITKPCRMSHTQLGMTRLTDRSEGEVRYYMQKPEQHVPFWSVLEQGSRNQQMLPDMVEAPYGQWDLEVMDAHGGWISTGPDLLRFVTSLNAGTSPMLSKQAVTTMTAMPHLSDITDHGPSWYGCGWSIRPTGQCEQPLNCHNIWHNGALDGTSTLLVRRWDGYSWAVLFNTDRSPDKHRLSSLIDPLVHTAVNAVDTWPDHNLFDKL